MIRRMKRQTKRRHSVLGGRKLWERRVVRALADTIAPAFAAFTIDLPPITEEVIRAKHSPDVWAPR